MKKFFFAKNILPGFFVFTVLTMGSCSLSKNYAPTNKYPAATLKKDFVLLQNILEAKHPSLYWYTPKDSMDAAFRNAYAAIKDSMTENQFAWKILAPLIAKIHCGHTSISYSKAYAKWAKGKVLPSFPLYMKVWKDTMAVFANRNPKDSIFKWGTLVTAVNGVPNKELIQNIFSYLPMDGYADNVNYIRLSGGFPRYHSNIYGLSKKYKVDYIDSSSGKKMTTILPLFEIKKDSTKKDSTAKPKKEVAKKEKKKLTPIQRLEQYRSFKIDSSGKFATLTLNSFTKGRIRSFFRHSFREMREKSIPDLIIDLRVNGGGRVGLSTLFTKYVSRLPFTVADSVYSKEKFTGPYTKYIQGSIFNNIALLFMTKKQADGNYHIGRLERKMYYLKTKNHYNGQAYILTNGATFSASTVFCNAVKGQPGITLVGEETGGGWYGNNGIFIPNITLPRTGLRVRLPLFRLVQYHHVSIKGTGVIPDVYIPPSYEALLQKRDNKMDSVKEMILKKLR